MGHSGKGGQSEGGTEAGCGMYTMPARGEQRQIPRRGVDRYLAARLKIAQMRFSRLTIVRSARPNSAAISWFESPRIFEECGLSQFIIVEQVEKRLQFIHHHGHELRRGFRRGDDIEDVAAKIYSAAAFPLRFGFFNRVIDFSRP